MFLVMSVPPFVCRSKNGLIQFKPTHNYHLINAHTDWMRQLIAIEPS